MSVDELRAGFARLAEPVVAMEDPYGRLLRRARRSRRARLTGWLSGLAAAIVAVLVTPLLVQSTGTPSPDPTPSPGVDDLRGGGISQWVRRLLDSPVRGSLGHDTAFLTTLTDRLAPQDFGLSPELNQKTVLFAGDAGSYRAVLVAFHSDSNQMGVWLVGDAGEDAARMAADAAADRPRQLSTPDSAGPVQVLPEELRPVSATVVADLAARRYLAIAVAPQGCQMATRDGDGTQQWRDAATVDYVVRTDAPGVDMSTWSKVTCDGTVRDQAPLTGNARGYIMPVRPSERQIDAALAGARGTPPDRAQVANAITNMTMQQQTSADTCRVLYAGPIPGSTNSSPGPGVALSEPPVLVTTCATRHGNTMFSVDTENGGGIGGYTRGKVGDPAAVLVVPGVAVLNGNQTTTDERNLVLAPPTATVLQVLTNGTVGQSLPLAAGIGSLVTPRGQVVQVRALDANGAVLGSGTAPTGAEGIPEEAPPDLGPVIDNWS